MAVKGLEQISGGEGDVFYHDGGVNYGRLNYAFKILAFYCISYISIKTNNQNKMLALAIEQRCHWEV